MYIQLNLPQPVIDMTLIISSSVRNKLANKVPPVSEEDIIQCFANRGGGRYLIDTRESNLTNPLTRWFIAETDFGRKLKVVFIPTKEGIVIKSTYTPNAEELRIYAKYG
jgi:hypothetical protein